MKLLCLIKLKSITMAICVSLVCLVSIKIFFISNKSVPYNTKGNFTCYPYFYCCLADAELPDYVISIRSI